MVNVTLQAVEARLSGLGLWEGLVALDESESDAGLVDVELSPVFAWAVGDYVASVGYGVASVTVAAAAVDERASVVVFVGDGAVEGFGVPLDVGENTVTVSVTAEDGTTTVAYVIRVTRAEAPEAAAQFVQ